MDIGTVDLFQATFWTFAGLAVLFGFPVTSGVVRRWVLCVLNLAFLQALSGWSGLFGIVAGMFAGWIGVIVLSRSRSPMRMMVIGLAVVAILFVTHKFRTHPVLGSHSYLNPLLVTVGFSYAALRWVDVIREVAEGDIPRPDFPSLVNYILPFHMLAAGPIQAYREFVDQPDVPEPLTFNEALSAVERIAGGMFKKFVLAALLQESFLTGFEVGGWYFFLEAQLFFLWLYWDFSAYSDIAVGVGKLIGVRTPENFNHPYLARNLIDFWDRWHISLSLFVRRNLFIPIQLFVVRSLQGNRPLLAASFSFTVSFIFVGMWHEIRWAYILWGGSHALGLVTVNLFRFALKKRWGAKGMQRYLDNRWARAGATVLTYEYVAFSLVLIGRDWGF